MSLLLDLLFPPQSLDFLSSLSTLPLDPFISPFEGRVSLYSYHSLSPLIQLIKYQFVTDFIPDLANLVSLRFCSEYPRLLDYWHQNHFLLTPVPLASYRQNWRGFNQSELLGQAIAQNLNLGYSDQILIRTRHTPPQVQLPSKSARLTNLKSAFALKPSFLQGRVPEGQVGFKLNLILFDDVFTTGSTLISAAYPLQSSVQRLWAFTLAA